MQLNDNTIKVLTNFATIQDNLVIKEGDKVLTMAEARNIVASATLDQSFPQDFGIYNLGEFLSVLSLVDDPTLNFTSEHVTFTDSVGKSRVKYLYSDESILTSPPGEPNFDSLETCVSFNLDEGTLNHIRKASGVFGYDKVIITPSNGNVLLSVLDPEDKTTNSYAVELPAEEMADSDFRLIISINNLKMIPGDYNVSIAMKLLSRFKNADDLTYFVALEKSSTFGE